jgi:very-short-patch-repair endonuclease
VNSTAINKLLSLAADQCELVTIQQAGKLGITPPMMRAATKRGWLRRLRRGVYVSAAAGPATLRPMMAATLAAGPDAVVSHATAAMIHKFHGIQSDDVELTIPGPCHRSLDGVRLHRSTTLLPDDVEERDGMRITSPIRTLIDIAARYEPPLLGRILDEGTIARAWTAETVLARIDTGARGVVGVSQLRPLLALRVGEGRPDSQLEQRVIRVVKRLAPGYALHHQVVLDGDVIDMDIAWPGLMIDGEVDGLAPRAGSRTKLERTARRENILAKHGWRIVHFTAHMDDQTLIAQIAPLLGF